MKKLLLIFLTALSLSSFGQQLAEVTIHRTWTTRKDISVTPGMSGQWILGDDTARYFKPQAGKVIRMKWVAEEATATLVLKETIDNVSAIYRLPNGDVIPNTGANILTASWSHFSTSAAPFPEWPKIFHNQTCSFSNLIGSTATFTFTGKMVRVMGEKSNNKGKAGFKINNGPETIVDTFADVATNNSQIIFEANDLPAGPHTLTITVKESKYVLIDGARVYE